MLTERIYFLSSDVVLVWSQTFTHDFGLLNWNAAKWMCDCRGHLAVLDTEEKQMVLLNQV